MDHTSQMILFRIVLIFSYLAFNLKYVAQTEDHGTT